MEEEKGFLFHDSARKVILKKINFGVHSSEFMNAISLERILNDAIKKKSNRFCRNDDDSDEALAILMPEDFSEDYQDESLEELLAKLDAMIGLTNVKTQIRKKVSNVLTQMSADEIGAERDFSHGTLHMLFIGNPGTGKTTIASIIGKIYQQLNLLPNGGQVVYCTRGDLIAQYQGQSAPLVKAKFKEAEGGILFIDEAYSLWHGKNDNFGKEAVDEIITQMENNKENMMVILAGYKKEMEEFLRNSNLGWNSRIKDKIEFEDYTVEEMTSIFIGMVADKKMQLENGSEKVIYTLLEEKSKVPNFGNARGVRNIFEDVLSEQSERIVLLKFNNRELRKEDYDTIKIEDLEKVTSKKNFSEKKLDDFLNELTSLTGLASVKKVVQELVNKVQVKKYMEQLGVQNNSDFGTLHLVFKGNSGTGKTTVARLLGQIYVKLGVLKKNIFIEAGRKDLVAEYLGQTVPRVINLLDRADGGILFIDEAYSLISDERDAFGREAVTALVSELENRRESLIVILAGYAREMDEFLDTNQGLASRFSNEIIFEDYSSDELVEIFKWMVNKKELILDDKITDELICETIIKKKSKVKDFANARGVRNVLDSIQSNKDTRIATAIRNGDEPTLEEIKTILVADMLL